VAGNVSYLATTRAALLRGSSVDGLGDEVDDNGTELVGFADFPAAITEKSRAVYDPATGERRTVRVVTGRVPADLPVQDGDRIRDNRTGIIYPIGEYTLVPRNLAGQSSLTLDLTGS
jgi:hypothetical protein